MNASYPLLDFVQGRVVEQEVHRLGPIRVLLVFQPLDRLVLFDVDRARRDVEECIPLDTPTAHVHAHKILSGAHPHLVAHVFDVRWHDISHARDACIPRPHRFALTRVENIAHAGADTI